MFITPFWMSEHDKINKRNKSEILAYFLWSAFGVIGAAHFYSEAAYWIFGIPSLMCFLHLYIYKIIFGAMKKIHFNNQNNWLWITILILSVGLILIGSFELIEFENPKIIDSIGAFGFGLFAAYYSRMFWYKNYVQWNKKGAVIKINSFLGTTLNFNQIKTTELIEKKLIITKLNGKQVTFDLNDIESSDSQKLNDIIVKNTVYITA